MISFEGLAPRWIPLMLAALFLGFGAAACGPDYPNCENDEHCAEKGEYCFNGKCSECRQDNHCAEGHRCAGGACEKIPGWCKSESDCIGKEKCRDNQCGPECLDDSECGENEVCKDGSCQLKAECVVDADCPAGKECANGTCIDATASVGECDNLEPIYFDFDQSALRADARDTLRNHAECMKDRNAKVTIEGHCDERGTEEYNLALGERRARSAKNYLASLGVRRPKMSTISYGESRPAKYGSGPEVWSANRRCEFVWK